MNGTLPHELLQEMPLEMPPKRLFKYMKAEHLEMALTRGTFKIGTLHDFRNQERLGDWIGDKDEGKRSFHLTPTEQISFDPTSDDPRAVHTRKVIGGFENFAPGQATIVMHPMSCIETREDVADAYIFCTTHEYDEAEMLKAGYDTCLVIDDVQGFFAEISNCLDADWLCCAPVIYGDRRIEFAASEPPSAELLKPIDLESQREVRAIWEPREHPIEPRVIDCPRALQYCDVYRPAGEKPSATSVDFAAMDAVEIDALIARAARSRAQIEPKIPLQHPDHAREVFKPAWWTCLNGENTILQIRHPGMGWITNVLCPHDRAQLLGYLQKQSEIAAENLAKASEPESAAQEKTIEVAGIAEPTPHAAH
jgi:hypothetical protein